MICIVYAQIIIKTRKVEKFTMMFIAAVLIGSVVCIAEDNNAAFRQKRNQRTHYKISLKRLLQLKVQTVFQMMVFWHYVPTLLCYIT
jgi:phosphatidylserine decarboxylase